MSVVSFEGHKAQRFIETALLQFYDDPPDSDHQMGFMRAMIAVYRDCLKGEPADDRIRVVLAWDEYKDEGS